MSSELLKFEETIKMASEIPEFQKFLEKANTIDHKNQLDSLDEVFNIINFKDLGTFIK